MSCCAPTNLGYCSQDTCRQCTVPTFAFPDQAQFGAATLAQCVSANGVLSATNEFMQHQEPFLLVSGTSYAKNGALFLQLGTQEYMSFTAHPIFPLSEIFYFRAHKYPIGGVNVSENGQVPYQSSGSDIREGDTVFLTSLVGGHALAAYGAPSPYLLPQFSVPQQDTLRNWNQFGTASGETIRIVSEDYDPSIPPDEQPKVSLTGSKAYNFMFTRIGQNLAVLPGATPAPCVARLTNYSGGPARLIPLSAAAFYNLPRSLQPAQAANGNATAANGNATAANGNATAANGNATAANGNATASAEQVAASAADAAKETANAAQNAAAAAANAAKANDVTNAINAAKAANRAAEISNNAATAAVNAANAAGRNSTSLKNAFEAQNAAKVASKAAEAAANSANKALNKAK